jgi:hypothetical protein
MQFVRHPAAKAYQRLLLLQFAAAAAQQHVLRGHLVILFTQQLSKQQAPLFRKAKPVEL